MLSRLAAFSALVTLLWTSPPTAPAPVPAGEEVLLVTASKQLSRDDEAVRARLSGLGFRVVVAVDRDVTAATARDEALVVVSSTTAPGALVKAIGALPVPIVSRVPATFSPLGLAGSQPGVDFGTASGREVLIANAAHPMAARLTGRVAVADAPAPLAWVLPGPGTIEIASLADNANRAVVLGCEEGAATSRGRAPARRVALPGSASFTREGWRLFDAGVRWAFTRNTPPRVAIAGDHEVAAGATLRLFGSVLDDGAPEPPWVQVGWTLVSGPADATFESPSSHATSVRFTTPGDYIVRLTANDGLASASAEYAVTVGEADASSTEAFGGIKPTPLSLVGQKVTLVTAATATTNDTTKIGSILQNMGAGSVVTVADNATGMIWSNAIGGASLIVVSASITPGNLGNKLTAVATPVVVMKSNSYGNMLMTGVTSGTHFGSTGAQTQIAMATSGSSHPASAGLTGTVTATGASSTYGWGIPGSGATIIATLASDSTKPVIFAYDTGATMFGTNTAPARRVGFFPAVDATDGHLSDNNALGEQLFRAACAWASQTNLAPRPNAGPDLPAAAPTGTTINGTVFDDGLPGGSNYLQATWTQVSGPGTATFAPATCAGLPILSCPTSVTFSALGSYTLRLKGDDGVLNATDDVNVTVVANSPPVPSASGPGTATLPSTIHLVGSATDDGNPNPPHALSCPGGNCWTLVSGPGPATFSPANALITDATVTTRGTYVFRFSVTDGAATSTAPDVTVTVLGNALIVTDDTSGHGGPFPAELERLGYQVTLKTSSAVTLADATAGWSLIYVSSRTAATNVGTALVNASMPVIVSNSAYYVDLHLVASGTVPPSFGADPSQAKIVIPDFAKPLAGGLHGTVVASTVPGSYAWGRPPGNATTAATLGMDPTKIAIFGFKKNDLLVGGTPAPARRIGFFLPDPSMSGITPAGLALVDAAILWSTGDGVAKDNMPPAANAGSDQEITLNGTIVLPGLAADDGLPSGTLSCPAGGCWTVVSGPTPTFTPTAPPTPFGTNATFSQSGTYVLRLTVTDGALTGSDDVTVKVGNPGANLPPVVDPGFDQTISLSAAQQVLVTGEAYDDGLPTTPGVLSCLSNGCWTKQSGPGSVTFTNDTVDPPVVSARRLTSHKTVTFAAPGTYVLRFSVTDGASPTDDGNPNHTSFGTITVSVRDAALLVVNDSNFLDPRDIVIKTRLEALGYDVTVVKATDPYPTTGKAIAIQAPSAADGDICPGSVCKLSSATIPVVTMIASAFSDMKLTGGVDHVDRDFTDPSNPQTSVTINPAAPTAFHPMTAGLQGTVVANATAATYAWGMARYTTPGNAQVPPDDNNAQAIATLVGDSTYTKAVVFAYDTGKKLVDGTTAPARRVGFGLFDGMTSLTPTGQNLFDAMVRWATGTNTSPRIAMASNAEIVMPSSGPGTAALSASIYDDGATPVTGTWSATSANATFSPQSCTGPAGFPNSLACATTANFAAAGQYLVTLTATDGVTTPAGATILVTVLPNSVVNQPPAIDAGIDQHISILSKASLHATVSDDGLPLPSSMTVNWTVVSPDPSSGGGTVTFTPSATGTDVQATFSAPGTYILRATANDGAATSSDTLMVTVDATVAANTAMLFTNTTNCAVLAPEDAPIKARLEAHGYTVSCSNGSVGIGSSKLVVFSPKVNGQNITVPIKPSQVPMIVMEQTAFPTLGMAGTTSGSSFGTTSATQLDVKLPSHPLAAGLSGSVSVKIPPAVMRWANLSGASGTPQIVATITGDPSKATIFAYDKGATLFDGTAAAHRRVGLFGYDNLATPQGAELFEAAINWALGTSVKALFVVGNATSPNASDTAIKARLENTLGFQVTLVQSDATLNANSATDKYLVLISSTTNAANVLAKFRDTPVPVVVWQSTVFDDMAMATTIGTLASQMSLSISDDTSPLLTGIPPCGGGVHACPLQVANSLVTWAWGVPAASAMLSASIITDGTKATVFGYDYGATMVGSVVAPDRRVGLFFPSTFFTPTTPPANANAWAIFDASVRWAVGADVDGDGLTTFQEGQYGTDPHLPDTNGDGIRDGDEVRMGLDPKNMDMDGDTVANATELQNGTDPFNWDTDGDGFSDAPIQDCRPLDPTYPSLNPCPAHGSGDTTPPTITLTSPAGATFQGTQTCVPTATHPC